MSKLCTDHLGNEFNSIKEMCNYWNIPISAYRHRIKREWSLKDALTKETTTGKKCKDYLGNEFNSVKEMCDYWNISVSAYNLKIKNGCTLKDALTKETTTGKKCKDHLGNEFNSIAKMCKYWNISTASINRKINEGYTIQEAIKILTDIKTNGKIGTKCKDHLGNEFNSIAKMCEYWNVDAQRYYARLKLGWTTKDALTKDIRKSHIKCKDHLDNEFNSVTEMCNHWNISRKIFQDRMKRGWSLKNALTKETTTSKKYKDHLGNEFDSVTEMCKYYGISIMTYNSRIKRGMSLKDALTKKIKIDRKKTCKDCIGNEFMAIQDMCSYWHITIQEYNHRIRQKYSDLEILGIIPIITAKTEINTQITDNLKLIEKSFDKTVKPKIAYFVCENQNGFKDVYTRDELVKIMAKEKGLIVTYNLIKNRKTEPKRQRTKKEV